MDPKKLQRIVVDALEDVKAQDIRVFNTTDLTDLFDRVIIATGTSNRQTRALAAHVRDKAKEAGGNVISVEGTDTGEWVLVDLGDIVVHVMQPAIRTYYNLEELWGDKPVRVRFGPDPTKAGAATSRQAAVKTAARRVNASGEAAAEAPARSRSKAPDKSSGAATAKAPPRTPAKAPVKASTKAPVKAPRKTTGKASATPPGGGSTKTPARASGKPTGKASSKASASVPVKPARASAKARKPRASAT